MPETTAWHHTACILCSLNCGIEVRLDGRRLEGIRGDRAHPGSRGYACEKAQRLDHYQNGPHRLTSPLRRRPDGTFEPIGWDTAIAEVAERFRHVRDTYGGETLGALRMHPTDAARLGIGPGGRARLTTRRGAAEVAVELTDALQPGHVSLPNGLGLEFPGEGGVPTVTGVAPNELTASDDRDWLAGTPWHKHVPARIEAVATPAETA